MIRPSDIEKVGQLARVQLSATEMDEYAQKLGTILEYVHRLDQMDPVQVEPTEQILPLKNQLREDEQEKSLGQKEALVNGPGLEGPYFKTPKILG